MALKYFTDRKNMFLYPWYIADVASTKVIGAIAEGLVIKKVFVTFTRDRLSLFIDSPSYVKLGTYFLNKVVTSTIFFKKTIREIYRYSIYQRPCPDLNHKRHLSAYAVKTEDRTNRV